jgi:hypothetical protein
MAAFFFVLIGSGWHWGQISRPPACCIDGDDRVSDGDRADTAERICQVLAIDRVRRCSTT